MSIFRKLFPILFIINGFIYLGAVSHEWHWAQRAGGLGNGVGYDIVVDNEGNSYITGYVTDKAYFGDIKLESESENKDIFVAKIDSDSKWQWARRAGGLGNDEGLGITVDEKGNIYVTGYFQHKVKFGKTELISEGGEDIFIAKLGKNGEWIWAVKGNGPNRNRANDITVDKEGNAYITGYFTGLIKFGDISFKPEQWSENIFVAKIDSTGVWKWARNTTSTAWNLNQGKSVAVDKEGNVYLTGSIEGTTDFGDIELKATDRTDLFVAKLCKEGDWQWVEHAGSEDIVSGEAIAVDKDGNVYVTGFFKDWIVFDEFEFGSRGEIDLFVAKLDKEGKWLWAQGAGGTENCSARSLVLDDKSNVYITGSFSGNIHLGGNPLYATDIDVFVAQLDKKGNWQWAEQANGNDWDISHGIGLDDKDNMYTTGYFRQSVWFGDTRLVSQGWNDIFVAKLGHPTTDIIADNNRIAEVNNVFSLNKNQPNPFNPQTVISYQLYVDVNELSLAIYNSKGQKVKTLVEAGFQNKGEYSIVWDGTNNEGENQTSGIYFYRLATDTHHEINKMLLLK